MHEVLREVAMRAYEEIEAGQPNPLVELLESDERLHVYLTPEAIRDALDVRDYVGDAPERALAMAHKIREVVSNRPNA
jgi:adenylosuccinate lyase